MPQITHQGRRQIVPPAELRRILRADGEHCYCAPDETVEWDAGWCPEHQRETRQQAPTTDVATAKLARVED
jgi:hypothetical protein